jgi:hypothetical protein
MKLVTVKTFDNSIDAHILKSKLESEGVDCYLFDEHLTHLYPIYNVTLGGIKLKINEFDTQKVIALLNEIDNTPLTDNNGDIIKCASCNSLDFYSGFKSMSGFKGVLSAIVAFALTLYPLYYKTVYKCKNCGNEFKA